MTVTSVEGHVLAGLYATDEVTASRIKIRSWAGTYATLLRVVLPVDAGDVLDVTARARVTNDTSPPGYTVGVGYHLWAYDVDNGLGASGPWTRISTWCGDNVPRDRHHMPLHTDTVYTVPEDWPAGHRIVVVLRGDAHSTRADGQYLTVDQEYGHLTVRRYAPAAQ